MPKTSFSVEYIISVVVALASAYGIAHATPNLSPILTFVIIPLAVAYIVLQLLNASLPGLNNFGDRVSAYVENKTLGEINRMGYIQVFPPLMAITILVFVLLFTKNLA